MYDLNCIVTFCTKAARPSRRYCSGHAEQVRQGKKLTPIAHRPHAKHRRPLSLRVSPEQRFRQIGWSISPTGCWLWNGTMRGNGYGSFTLASGQRVGAHRFAVYLDTGVMPAPHQHVAHACDNPRCVNPAHLSAGSALANMQDMADKGRSAWGEKNANAKLTIDDVRAILMRSATGETSPAIAADYPVSARYVRSIVAGERWQTALRVSA
ncbi:HNH endonuclease [Curtobacterium sp. MCBA15_004]|uniref:HNH endonuclease n=1 Tax=Curtobacterium sp. MCBA15_004 TaxID=1898733 RepID=UPI001114D2C8|nr:HNH endonuclease [Curtobacterium sp. MCBA15_004]WIA95815.1 HNH endonuclease [Curtobacterium sp. MCBA15_004]